MRALHPSRAAWGVDAVAEELPFKDLASDAAMASFAIQQWRDLHNGLRELRRVSSGPVVILPCDPDACRH